MKIIDMNTKKTHRSNYGKYSKLNDDRTKIVNGIEVPASSSNFTQPYLYRASLFFDDEAGVKTKHLGVALRELRKQYNVSRRAFAELANSQVAQYGIHVTTENIISYERMYRWYDKRTGKSKEYNACSPKPDKLLGIVMGRAALTGESFEEAMGRMCGYTKVVTRDLNRGA